MPLQGINEVWNLIFFSIYLGFWFKAIIASLAEIYHKYTVQVSIINKGESAMKTSSIYIVASIFITIIICSGIMKNGVVKKNVDKTVVIKPAITIAKSQDLTDDFAVPVLMYHRICNLTPREEKSPLMRDLTVSPADFENQVRYLTENDFSILNADELVDALRYHKPLPVKSVVLTMDDGYRDNFTDAFPVLNKYGIPATVFLVTSVAGRSDHISWDEASVMSGAGWGIESHTINHYDLPTLNDEILTDEIVISKQIIEEHLKKPVTQLAYPSGAFDSRVTKFTRNAGYLAGWKKGGGPVMPGCDPYKLPRVRVHGRTTLADFERKVWSGVWARKMADKSRNAEI